MKPPSFVEIPSFWVNVFVHGIDMDAKFEYKSFYLPPIGARVYTDFGNAVVTQIDFLRHSVEVRVDVIAG